MEETAACPEAYDRVRIAWFLLRGYPIRGIIHVGANDGYEVQWYKQLGIHNILCFEPLVDAWARFKENNPGVEIVKAALGNLDGRVRLRVTPGDGQGSSLLPEKPPERYQETSVDVALYRFASWADMCWADVHKNIQSYNCLAIDTQGTELDVLRGMDDYLDNFELLNIECSARPIYKGGASAAEVVYFLSEHGFSQVTPISRHDDILFIRADILHPEDVYVPSHPRATIQVPVKAPEGNKLNCGSGQRPFDQKQGWINMDINPEWKPDLVGDWNDLTIFSDSSMDLVVSHHSLEHVGCGEAKTFIREAWRVLKPGCSLLIFVPNMRALVERWLVNQMDTQIFMTNVYGAYMGNVSDRHFWGYDRESLKQFVRSSCEEWTSIVPFNWRPISGASIAQDFWILGMEAIK